MPPNLTFQLCRTTFWTRFDKTPEDSKESEGQEMKAIHEDSRLIDSHKNDEENGVAKNDNKNGHVTSENDHSSSKDNTVLCEPVGK
jgi:hypothetical protein